MRLGTLALLLVAGCAAPGGARLDVTGLLHADRHGVRLYYTEEIARRDAQEVATVVERLADVWAGVERVLGATPPRVEPVLHRPLDQSLRRAITSLEVRAHLGRGADGWRIRFRYPFTGGNRGDLLSATAHEVAEATIMLRVTVLDPYVRWMHDGVAELVEHLVMLEVQPHVARNRLRRTIAFVSEWRAEGYDRIDLRRWRQLAPVVVRSHRLLGRTENLSLGDLPGSQARVRAARAATRDPARVAALDELSEILSGAVDRAARPWAVGDARPGHPVARDYLFYAAAFAYWLELERANSGTARAFAALLAARREAGDHVLTAWEVEGLVAEAAGQAGGLARDLSAVTTEDVLEWLRAEQKRLARR